MKEEEKYEKVVFRYFSSVLDETVVETMWAKEVDQQSGIYQLDSIPFYGPQIATDDEFFAEYDASEQRLTFRRVTRHSGNSVVLVIITKPGIDKETIREEFRTMNCHSEGVNNVYFSMEILESVSYRPIKKRLDELEDEGIIEYAEPCLSNKHSNEIKD